MKKIFVEHGTAIRLATLMRCTQQEVSLALMFKRNSRRAIAIRTLAVRDFGGKEIEI